MEPSVSVVIPAYDEAENLPALLAELRPPLDSLGRPYEIVDDGATHAEVSPASPGDTLRCGFCGSAGMRGSRRRFSPASPRRAARSW
jgi:hypothetical protein